MELFPRPGPRASTRLEAARAWARERANDTVISLGDQIDNGPHPPWTPEREAEINAWLSTLPRVSVPALDLLELLAYGWALRQGNHEPRLPR